MKRGSSKFRVFFVLGSHQSRTWASEGGIWAKRRDPLGYLGLLSAPFLWHLFKMWKKKRENGTLTLKEDRDCSATDSYSSTYPVYCKYMSMPGGTVCIVRMNQKDLSTESCSYFCVISALPISPSAPKPSNISSPQVYKIQTLLPVIELLKPTLTP